MTNEFDLEESEQLAGYNCPVCGYPVVVEMGLELCYHCGWSKGEEHEGYYEE
jgi:competence CoiA-like predicted nuclease